MQKVCGGALREIFSVAIREFWRCPKWVLCVQKNTIKSKNQAHIISILDKAARTQLKTEALRADALAQSSGKKFDMIPANPPFGKKGGYTIVGEDGKISTECYRAIAYPKRRSHTAWPTSRR
ncbi:MAG: hypothetical protein AB8D78_00260 [Akkermansiaceae bacterium]